VSGELSTDVVARAKAALEKLRQECANSDDTLALRLALAIDDIATLVPELVAEVERLRAGGPWVERMNAMKRERDGGCICDCNPETTDGPDEFCPWHGRTYRELVEGLESQAAEVERLQGLTAALKVGQGNQQVLLADAHAEIDRLGGAS
jgi:hypothetical protein